MTQSRSGAYPDQGGPGASHAGYWANGAKVLHLRETPDGGHDHGQVTNEERGPPFGGPRSGSFFSAVGSTAVLRGRPAPAHLCGREAGYEGHEPEREETDAQAEA